MRTYKRVTEKKYSISATKRQVEQIEYLKDQLRWSVSKLVRIAIDLLETSHREDRTKYGVK